MNENYEVNGSVRTLEQRREYKPLTPTVDRLRDFESFDVEFSPEGLVQKLTTYTHMGVLDGSERHIYDRKGNQIQTLKFDDAGVQISQSDIEYNVEEGRVEWTTRNVSGDLVSRGVEKAVSGSENLLNLWVLCPNCHANKTCGIIEIDVKTRNVSEHGNEITLVRDNHLFV